MKSYNTNNTFKDENVELKNIFKKYSALKNYFGGNTGCQVVLLLDKGQCKLWKVLAF